MINRNKTYEYYAWFSSSENTILFKNMDDNYIKNTINMLKGWVVDRSISFYHSFLPQEWLDLFLKYTNQYEVKTKNYEIW